MTASITTVCALRTPLDINSPNKNLVISGVLRSDFPIILRIKNLIVLGEVITKSDLTIEAQEEIYNFGTIRAGNISSKPFTDHLDQNVREKLESLFVYVDDEDPLKLAYRPDSKS